VWYYGIVDSWVLAVTLAAFRRHFVWGNFMRKVDRWLREDGLAKIAGWRRWGADLKEVAGNMGVSFAQLKRWAAEFEEIGAVLELDGEGEDFLVEGVVLDKALGGDQKAIEFWLRYRGRGKASRQVRGDSGGVRGDSVGVGAGGVDYVLLADLILGE